MNIRKFIIQICGVFLSMSLSKTVEKIITAFSWFTLISGVLIFFLSLNFFFAKFKQLQESDEAISLIGFVFNVLTLSCFAAMPFLINNFVGLMCAQIFLRIFDISLIFYNNKWNRKNIDKVERRWLYFDFTYLLVICGFIAMNVYISYEYLSLILISMYLLMGIFESIFDFIVNRHIYGMVLQKAEIPKETVELISESEIAQNESNVKIVESHNVNAEVKGKQK